MPLRKNVDYNFLINTHKFWKNEKVLSILMTMKKKVYNIYIS